MRPISVLILTTLILVVISSCNRIQKSNSSIDIIFLHQSTGGIIWQGKNVTFIQKLAGRIKPKLKYKTSINPILPSLFKKYNKSHNTHYNIAEMLFPEGQANHPYNYYNLWVKNAGNLIYIDQPTLEKLTKEFNVVIFKHCYTASHIELELGTSDINSSSMTLSNYKSQYNALRDKLHTFPDVKFILFTIAVEVKSKITEEEASLAREFYQWVRDEWDLPGDNIYLWDLYSLQTDGGLYFKDEYAISPNDSHPNKDFAFKSSSLLFNRILDVIENDGNKSSLTGKRY